MIGWTYVKATNKDQKYKEGKFVIEKSYLLKVSDEKASESTKNILGENTLACFGS